MGCLTKDHVGHVGNLGAFLDVQPLQGARFMDLQWMPTSGGCNS